MLVIATESGAGANRRFADSDGRSRWGYSADPRGQRSTRITAEADLDLPEIVSDTLRACI